MTDEQPAMRRTLAEKLNHLVEIVHPADRGPYSNEEVASAVAERNGTTISGTYIWQLRKGLRDNPTKKHLEALAEFFGVPVSYFFDDEVVTRVDAQLALANAMRDSGVRMVALRAAGITPKSLSVVMAMLDRVREFEGLKNPNSVYDQSPDATPDIHELDHDHSA